jgi:hypothetical protein
MICTMAKPGRPINEKLRARIQSGLDAGKSQAQIARELDRAPSTIAKIVRALGVRAKVYGRIVERADGKRKCGGCGKWKTLGAFPTERDSRCRVCYGQSGSSPAARV